MGKLHEVLAVEGDKEGIYKKINEETVVTFAKKSDHFHGQVRVLTMFDEKDQGQNTIDRKELVTTVKAKLDYLSEAAVGFFDVVLQKESTNQTAVADLVVDGVVLATNLPATFLLGLEAKLKTLRATYETIPTLAPGFKWVKNPTLGEDIYETANPEEKLKTAKQFKHQVLVPATDKFQAQIEKWEEQVPVGKYNTTYQSGMLSPAEKSAVLGRIDKLIQAAKQARMRANTTEVINRTIGKELFKFING